MVARLLIVSMSLLYIISFVSMNIEHGFISLRSGLYLSFGEQSFIYDLKTLTYVCK